MLSTLLQYIARQTIIHRCATLNGYGLDDKSGRLGYQQNDCAEGSPCLQEREHLLKSVADLSVGARQGSREGLVVKSKEVWSDQLHTANVNRGRSQ